MYTYETTVSPDWIDYNGHMQDAYYGLVFSHAVDGIWDAIGIDAAYRKREQATIYLVEDHKRYLAEVKAGAPLRVETRVLGVTDKLIHLYLTMASGTRVVAVCEFLEAHVSQRGTPRTTPLPDTARAALAAQCLSADEAAALPHRSRAIALKARG